MPLRPDVQDFITTIVYDNLTNLLLEPPVLVVPPGFENFILAIVFNNYTDLGLPEDLSQLVAAAVTSNNLVVVQSSNPVVI